MPVQRPPSARPRDPRVAVVIATRNRRPWLLETLAKLETLPERPHLTVVDNASTDGTAGAVRARHPDVRVLELPVNLGGAARTLAARRLPAPYVAFSDDDSWWEPGALSLAADLMDRHPRLAVVAARVLVGPEGYPDPTCEEMATTRLPLGHDLPGNAVLGFIACGSVVRRSAFLAAGGFRRAFGIGGEEELLAIDLTVGGWGLAYVDEVVARHHPFPNRDPSRRRSVQLRNALWVTWLRRPAGSAMRRTRRLIGSAPHEPAARAGAAEALGGIPWVLRERRVVPPRVELALQMLESTDSRSGRLDRHVSPR